MSKTKYTPPILYRPFPSSRADKKYSVYVKGEDDRPQLIHFGARGHEQFKDTTGVGAYSHKDHNDPHRRELYRRRHKGILKGDGTPAYLDKNSPAWWSWNKLW